MPGAMKASLTLIINTTSHANTTSLRLGNTIQQQQENESLGTYSSSSNYYNEIPMDPGQQPLYAQVIIVLMYVLLIIVAVGGNLLFSYVIVMRAKMPSVTNLFLLNLAISDLMKALICNPFTFMANLIWNYWPYGEFLCPVVTYIQVVTVFLSAFTLVAMSVDRYVAILRPMRPKMSRRAFIIIMTTIWILSFSVPLPTALTSSVIYQTFRRANDGNDSSSFGSSTSSSSAESIGSTHSATDNITVHTHNTQLANASGENLGDYPRSDAYTFELFERGLCLEIFENEQHRYIYSVMIMMLQYFVPLAVITVTNSHIGYIVWIKKTPGEAEADRDRRMAASKRRLVKMIIIVVVIYAVCWLPLHVITVVGDHNPAIYEIPHIDVVWLCAHWLAMSHSCYNPIVYFSLNTTFRHNLKRMVLICRTSLRRQYRNRKRRCRRGDNNNDNTMGSASSLQQNGGLGTGGTSGGGDWTISADMDEEETEFGDDHFIASRNCSTRSPRTAHLINKTGPGCGVLLRGGLAPTQPEWKCVTNLHRKCRKKDMYV